MHDTHIDFREYHKISEDVKEFGKKRNVFYLNWKWREIDHYFAAISMAEKCYFKWQ